MLGDHICQHRLNLQLLQKQVAEQIGVDAINALFANFLIFEVTSCR